ncbi:MAG: Ribosome hibernation promoting factor [Phycisphaerae bacterium]|nr:MAG: ribosome-associated translation inhibitor RaiA [Planctomycetota bacterium]KAB2950119.1 MAG: ribosome-associated translation inhibitor RaiA [Phycisphaerae bacterium]MBE7456454.1 ribosome-associated translation inhibitor RaiA [Planctomycetia bacterium]MCG3131697.1 Ribosome hibernation promoting factor [Phycisphaerae bacterium]MCK6465338.1 ribosome-associated translation inhibitor RaiA [Phycisphaerae bacterium]
MQLTVKSRHVEVPEEIRKYAETKASKLPRFLDRISAIEFVLDQESDLWTAELIVKVDRASDFVAKETGPDRYALIDSIVEKVERQLIRHKEKVKDHHPRQNH